MGPERYAATDDWPLAPAKGANLASRARCPEWTQSWSPKQGPAQYCTFETWEPLVPLLDSEAAELHSCQICRFQKKNVGFKTNEGYARLVDLHQIIIMQQDIFKHGETEPPMSESYKSHYSCMEICSSKRGKKEMSRSAPTFDAARSLVKYSILLLPKGAKEKRSLRTRSLPFR